MGNTSFQQTIWESGEPLGSKKLEQMAHNDCLEYTYANENPKGLVGRNVHTTAYVYPKTYIVIATVQIDAVPSKYYLIEAYLTDACEIAGHIAIFRIFINGKSRAWMYGYNNSATVGSQNNEGEYYMHYIWKAPDKIEENPYTITLGGRSYSVANAHQNTGTNYLWVTDIGTNRTEPR